MINGKHLYVAKLINFSITLMYIIIVSVKYTFHGWITRRKCPHHGHVVWFKIKCLAHLVSSSSSPYIPSRSCNFLLCLVHIRQCESMSSAWTIRCLAVRSAIAFDHMQEVFKSSIDVSIDWEHHVPLCFPSPVQRVQAEGRILFQLNPFLSAPGNMSVVSGTYRRCRRKLVRLQEDVQLDNFWTTFTWRWFRSSSSLPPYSTRVYSLLNWLYLGHSHKQTPVPASGRHLISGFFRGRDLSIPKILLVVSQPPIAHAKRILLQTSAPMASFTALMSQSFATEFVPEGVVLWLTMEQKEHKQINVFITN